MDKSGATAMMEKMRADAESNTGREVGTYTIATADDFTYVDPVDGSVAKKQGIRFLMSDGSRVIFRLSGTAGAPWPVTPLLALLAGSGATKRSSCSARLAPPAVTRRALD